MFRGNIIIAILTAVLMVSCISNPNKPGREFIPDMAHSKAYEGYFENPGQPILKEGMNAQLPPEGSIAQSFDVYPFPNSIDGYNAAGEQLTNPFEFTADEISGRGQMLYTRFCSVCHGDKGDGQGHLVNIGKFPPPPSYFMESILTLPEGKRYHTLMFGKNMMGSYATQLSYKDRWLVLSYVQKMQDDFSAGSVATDAPAADSTNTL
jgi:mono/diheme cytochrome c family protein